MTELERFIADRQWTRLADWLALPENALTLPEIAASLAKAGEQHETAGQLASALHCHRLAVWALARHQDNAPDYDERRRRWLLLQNAAWPFCLTHRKYLAQGGAPRDADGEPLTVDALWEDAWAQLQLWAKAGDFESCRKRLSLLEALRDDDGDRGIRNAGLFESIGDQLAPSHSDAARWFYQQAALGFSDWVSSSSSGGEGTARSRIPNSAVAKLKALDAPPRHPSPKAP